MMAVRNAPPAALGLQVSQGDGSVSHVLGGGRVCADDAVDLLQQRLHVALDGHLGQGLGVGSEGGGDGAGGLRQ